MLYHVGKHFNQALSKAKCGIDDMMPCGYTPLACATQRGIVELVQVRAVDELRVVLNYWMEQSINTSAGHSRK